MNLELRDSPKLKYEYHRDGTQPKVGQIFVFGSNLAGVHGAGAAKAAMKTYGAKWGIGIGPTGASYAIPTKDENIDSMPLSMIEPYINSFIEYAKSEYSCFFVTRIGCGLAGNLDSDIAPMFKGAPTNCNFPEEWKEYLE